MNPRWDVNFFFLYVNTCRADKQTHQQVLSVLSVRLLTLLVHLSLLRDLKATRDQAQVRLKVSVILKF